MRLPIKEDDYFAREVNSAFEIVKDNYLLAIKPQIEMKKVNAMLGDGSVTQIDCFEPQRITIFYQQLIDSLKCWTTTGISTSKTEDLHRLYCQFTRDLGQYRMSGYFGIQFHALPYYRVDKRIIEIQKELSRIAVEGGTTFRSMADKGNHIVQNELESIGYAQLGFEELLEKLFQDESLVADLEKKTTSLENEFPEFEEMRHKKEQLFLELNDLLMELCQISPVLIDHNKLMQGEEGVVTYFDIEKVKNQKTKETDSYINTKRMTKELTAQVVSIFSEMANTLLAVRMGIEK
ncbi:MAG TPA: hypothetical protein VFI73_10915 [Candidatus Nitrosopolaris sp.]|nr:hypothetical protein [Candidatus Nitrosopolaris sp.]